MKTILKIVSIVSLAAIVFVVIPQTSHALQTTPGGHGANFGDTGGTLDGGNGAGTGQSTVGNGAGTGQSTVGNGAGTGQSTVGSESDNGILGIENMIISILNKAVVVIFGLAVIMFIVGIIKYLSTSGDAKSREEWRNYMIYGVISLAVISGLWGIVHLVTDVFGINFAGPQFPTTNK